MLTIFILLEEFDESMRRERAIFVKVINDKCPSNSAD